MKLPTIIFGLTFLFYSCTENIPGNKNDISPRENEFYNGVGAGPVLHLVTGSEIDKSKTELGEKIFNSKCVSCHQLTAERLIGPGLEGITKRRRPEWIMNQILDPAQMTKTDSLSKELLNIYLTQMTDMNLSETDARNILEFFRLKDSGR